MLTRSLFRVLVTSGVLAVIGYLMAPRRKKRGFSFNLNRMPISMKDVMRMAKASRKMIRAAVR
ncbi:hypothetical protein ACAF76_014425 [Brevibacillus sp. TJ4]|uniref:hypothetical protein n=1 Tax=Brevibacillus sp. TJ4 TaxID=3234853 RepID=UPI003BA0DDD3